MTPQDLGEVLALQAQGYPAALHDSADAFLSRMALAPALNLVAHQGEDLQAYLISHPWAAGSPPPVDSVLPTAAPQDCWYVHDLSVAEAARGLGLARRLLIAGRDAALTLGLTRSELIAVEGAAPFWRRQGWSLPAIIAPDLAAKVGGYGPSAVFMTCENIAAL